MMYWILLLAATAGVAIAGPGKREAATTHWVLCSVENSFLCDVDDRCINNTRKCDGQNDCSDGSDEQGCRKEPFDSCSGDQFFKCGSGECISKVWVCDEEFDCHDHSDELTDCGPFAKKHVECKPDERKCKTSGLCLPSFWWCDGQLDCVDGSDESECEDKACTEFTCDNGECIPNRWKCDESRDCKDGSDEKDEYCSQTHTPESCSLDDGWFLCADAKKCLNATLSCNEKPDCDDGSDEGVWCKQSCKDHDCEHRCIPTPKGPQCLCQEGFAKIREGGCADVNECAEYGRCSQVCVNTEGSFRCECKEGYHMDSEGVCRAFHGEPKLLFSTKTEIRAMDLRSKDNDYFLVAPNVSHSHQSIGVAFDSAEGRVYWSAIKDGHEGILSSHLDGTGKEFLVQDGLKMVEDLALDYVGRNLYFTDSANKFIGVANLHTKRWGVLIKTSVEKPRAVAVYPPEGLLFYTDWGANPAVMSAGMDGTRKQAVISTDIHWPNGVTVDVVMRRIFWSDAKLNKLESAYFDGSDRRRVIEDDFAKHPFSLAIFENTLYWSDWQTREILSCNKFDGKNQTTLAKERHAVPYGITIAHFLLEPRLTGPNPCSEHRCSHMCLLSPNQEASCFCPEGTRKVDEETCEEMEPVAPKEIPNPRILGFSPQDNEDASEDDDKTTAATPATPTQSSPPLPPSQPTPSDIIAPPPTKNEEGSNNDQFGSRMDVLSPDYGQEKIDNNVPSSKSVVGDDSPVAVADDDADADGVVIGIVIIAVLLIAVIMAFLYIRKRRNEKARPVALMFGNRDFRHGRMTSGSEELKNVQVVRKHSDGTFRNLASSPMPTAASYHDLHNDNEFNPRLGPSDALKRSATNPNVSAPQNVYPGMETPLGSSPMTDDDEIDVFTADRLGDKARLL